MTMARPPLWWTELARGSPDLEPYARAALDGLIEGGLTTRAFAELLWPEADARGPEQLAARQKLYRVLMVLAKGPMADCVSQADEVRNKFGGRPYHWHKPSVAKAPRSWEALETAAKAVIDAWDHGGHMGLALDQLREAIK